MDRTEGPTETRQEDNNYLKILSPLKKELLELRIKLENPDCDEKSKDVMNARIKEIRRKMAELFFSVAKKEEKEISTAISGVGENKKGRKK